MVRQRAAAGPPAPGLDNVTRTQLLFNWHSQLHYEFITFCFSGEALGLPGQYWRYVSLLKPRSVHRRGGRAIIAAISYSGLAFFFRCLLDGLAQLTCHVRLAHLRLPLDFRLSPARPVFPPGLRPWPILGTEDY